MKVIEPFKKKLCCSNMSIRLGSITRERMQRDCKSYGLFMHHNWFITMCFHLVVPLFLLSYAIFCTTFWTRIKFLHLWITSLPQCVCTFNPLIHWVSTVYIVFMATNTQGYMVHLHPLHAISTSTWYKNNCKHYV
jgi:hypothetical protein